MPFIPLLSILLDSALGEPRRAHPLVFFGRCANIIENYFHPSAKASFVKQQWCGFLAVLCLLLPITLLALMLVKLPTIGTFFSIALLYLCLGLKSLCEHANAIRIPLESNSLDDARKQVAMIVSRDTENMDETQITRATIESILENGNDAVFATLFWFFVFGAPGAVLLRTANTLDAMWGYRTDRYHYFGTFAAKLDDVLNWIPARLTAFTFALLGNFKRALHCWRTQASFCASPNGGPVMTAGAGALQITLGGTASYHGEIKEKIMMGEGIPPQTADIARALQLVQRSTGLWIFLYTVFYFFYA
ncbi:MAG: adenosylcobinamide-phosphate synthase CbiB [Pseudomonadales bacterium]